MQAQWDEAFDTYLGENMHLQDKELGVQLAAKCNHPEAKRFLSLVPVSFATYLVDDPTGLASFLIWAEFRSQSALLEAAQKGFPRALGKNTCLSTLSDEQLFEWASKAAEQNDRQGMYTLAWCYREGKGCKPDEKRYKDLIVRAAEAGWIGAMSNVVELTENKFERMKWAVRIGPYGHFGELLAEEVRQVLLLYQLTGRFANAVYLAGQHLKGQLDESNHRIFAAEDVPEHYFAACKIAVELYDAWTSNTRDQVVCWVLCAKQIGFDKDLRKVISKLVWESRTEGLVISQRRNRNMLKLMPGDEDIRGEIFSAGQKCINSDPERALEYFRVAAELGDANAQNTLGQAYSWGRLGCSTDLDEAVKWYTLAADQGHAMPQFALAQLYYYKLKEYDAAHSWLIKAAESDYAPALTLLGLQYMTGKGVPKDAKKACEYWMKAADLGFVTACYNISIEFFEGTAIAKDDEKAFYYTLKAAEQDHPEACYNLGYFYEHGVGVEKDPLLAVLWYQKSADAGDSDAQNALGWCYAQGNGVEQDLELAKEYLQQAAEQGHEEATTRLEQMDQTTKKAKKDEL